MLLLLLLCESLKFIDVAVCYGGSVGQIVWQRREQAFNHPTPLPAPIRITVRTRFNVRCVVAYYSLHQLSSYIYCHSSSLSP